MLNTMRPYSVYVFWDPAINLANTDMRRFINTRDPRHIDFRDGMRPMTFHCRPIRNKEALRVLMSYGHDEGSARVACFRAAVFRVENAYTLDTPVGEGSRPDIVPSSLVEHPDWLDESKVPKHDVGFIWSEDELWRTFDPTTVADVGEVIRTATFLPPSRSLTFTLPPSSSQLLTAQGDLLAAISKNRSTGQTSTPQGQPQTTTNDDSDDDSGDATAEDDPEVGSEEESPLDRSIRKSVLTGS